MDTRCMESLKKAIAEFRSALAVMAVFSLASNLLLLTIPLYMLQIYDRVLPSQSNDTLIFLTILAFFALLILGLMEAVRQILATRMAARLDLSLSSDVLRKVVRLGHFSNGNVQPMRDIHVIRNLLSSRVIFGLIDLPFSVIFIGLLYLIHPSLFWLTLAGAVVLAGLAISNQYLSQKPLDAQAHAGNSASRQAEHFARNADSVVAMGMLENVLASWGNVNGRSLAEADRASRINAIFTGLSRVIRLGIQIVILGYGAMLVLQQEMNAGMIFASSIISGRGLQPIDQVINSWRPLSDGWRAWGSLRRFLGADTERSGYTQLPTPVGDLQVEQAILLNPYDRTKPPLVNRISFELPAGNSVAVVGPSGSGKSTLARMIVGALAPSSGHVRLDGNDIANWDPQELGRHVGYLAQDVELLPGTVAQNISRFELSASDADIVAAASLAQVDEMIRQMPEGYDTRIGVGGIQISGGEKQRIALARAFYGDPKILVLDEPNSSLDRPGELALLKALAEAKKKKITVFLITQRESVLGAVDKIMRLQNGQIAEYDDRDRIIEKHAQAARERNRPAGLSTTIKM